MSGALWFLIRASFRNRVIARARRLRNPWYAVAALMGIAYFALIIWGRTQGAEMAEMAGARPARTPFEMFAPLLMAGAFVVTWIDSADLTALSFTQAEVAFLFTAPVARRQLIRYKLVRMQLPVLISSLLFAVILGRPNSPIPGVLVGVAYCALFSTIGLHRLGAALTRVSAYRRGASAPRRSWFGILFAAVLTVVVMLQMMPSVALRGATGGQPFDLLERIATVTSTGVVSVILSPFRMLSAPVFATSVSVWALGMLSVLAVLAVHYWWVLSADVVFEEAAAEVSERQARRIETMRRRQREVVPGAARTSRVLPLSPSGHPAVAIVWKNIMVLVRTWTLGSFVRPLLVAAVASLTAMRAANDVPQMIAIACACLAGMLLLAGPQGMRNDLRNDLLNLPLLKTAPLRGRDLVLAEVVSSAAPLALVQYVLLLVSAMALAVSAHPSPIDAGVSVVLAVTAPVALIALNGAMLALANGIVVFFPAWLRLGPNSAGGVEMMGQAMFGVLGMLVVFMVLLVVPGFAAAVTAALLPAGAAATAATATLVGSALLLVETYGIVHWVGGAFERLEPTHLT